MPSSYEVLTRAYGQLLSDAASLDEILKIWHLVGRTAEEMLLQRRNLRIERFGTFLIDAKGDPQFAVASAFRARNRVAEFPQPTPAAAVPTSKLNLA
eukprot:CAMPEP_0118867226 /NCGR_PEP_ID=MMETSP1163-20130328/10896_1 /TAXON_ID=124430 /ORGANISM="Phaeomonas parva, Strain CCMP2877" /LENGTH=96 /DNA_ID=CAMNT_0006801621 /DNA_START=58 /DNA_END=345 /DNA_ORIENTATION=-